MITAAELIRKREAVSPDGRNAKVLARLLSGGGRMSRMIEQLLDFTRLRVGGAFAIEPRSTDLASLARQVVDELDDSYPDCAVDVRQTGDTRGTWDGDRLCQVISNLVANAFQHGVPAAGIRVLIDGSVPDTVRVQVHNMGPIPPALVSQIFDPLTGGQRRRDRSRGLGLGLFITKRIAEAHGGDVTVSSSEADGTTFTLSIPRVADGAVAQEALARAGAAAPRQNINLAALAQDQLRESQARFRLLVEAVEGLRDLHARPDGQRRDLERGRRAHQGLRGRRDHRPALLAVLPARRTSAPGKCETRARGRGARGPLRGRGLARPQGRHAVLGERRHHRAARPSTASSSASPRSRAI